MYRQCIDYACMQQQHSLLPHSGSAQCNALKQRIRYHLLGFANAEAACPLILPYKEGAPKERGGWRQRVQVHDVREHGRQPKRRQPQVQALVFLASQLAALRTALRACSSNTCLKVRPSCKSPSEGFQGKAKELPPRPNFAAGMLSCPDISMDSTGGQLGLHA